MSPKYVIHRKGVPNAVLFVDAKSEKKAMEILDRFIGEYDGIPIIWECCKVEKFIELNDKDDLTTASRRAVSQYVQG